MKVGELIRELANHPFDRKVYICGDYDVGDLEIERKNDKRVVEIVDMEINEVSIVAQMLLYG